MLDWSIFFLQYSGDIFLVISLISAILFWREIAESCWIHSERVKNEPFERGFQLFLTISWREQITFNEMMMMSTLY